MDAEELSAKIKAFKATHAPDTASQLEWLRPTIVGFHLDGYSRKSTYEFLRGAGLVRCSQLAFYRWLAKHMDLEAEGRAFVAATPPVAEERATPTTPTSQGPAAGSATPISHAKLRQPVAAPVGRRATPAENLARNGERVGTGSMLEPISHAKLTTPIAASMGSFATAPAETPTRVGDLGDTGSLPDSISHAKLSGTELRHGEAATETQMRTMPAEADRHEDPLTSVAHKTTVLNPHTSPTVVESTASTIQLPPVRATQGKTPLSDEKRRDLVDFIRQQTKVLERNDMGAISDRVLAQLDQRDKENSQQDGLGHL